MEITSNHSVAIEIVSLCKTYQGHNKMVVKAVDQLNLSVPGGQVFGFLGTNGAGKTTTIKMICGVITPTSGYVSVNGYEVARQRSAAMKQIGVVLEGTRNVYWRLSAWDNLLYFGRLKGCWGESLKMRAEQLLRELELWERRKDPVRIFSRGMQQKVAIACALIADPPIILLDEPTLGLDIQAARTVKEWIVRLTREQGKTVVLTTHQLDIAQELCDHVAIMRKGRLLADQPLTALLDVFGQDYYEIHVKSDIDFHDQETLFKGLSVRKEDDETILTGAIADQAALFHYLANIRGLHIPLRAVNRVEPDLETVFMHLISEAEKGVQHEDRVTSHVQ